MKAEFQMGARAKGVEASISVSWAEEALGWDYRTSPSRAASQGLCRE